MVVYDRLLLLVHDNLSVRTTRSVAASSVLPAIAVQDRLSDLCEEQDECPWVCLQLRTVQQFITATTVVFKYMF